MALLNVKGISDRVLLFAWVFFSLSVRLQSNRQTDLPLIIRWTEIQREEQRPQYKLNSHCYCTPTSTNISNSCSFTLQLIRPLFTNSKYGQRAGRRIHLHTLLVSHEMIKRDYGLWVYTVFILGNIKIIQSIVVEILCSGKNRKTNPINHILAFCSSQSGRCEVSIGGSHHGYNHCVAQRLTTRLYNHKWKYFKMLQCMCKRS